MDKDASMPSRVVVEENDDDDDGESGGGGIKNDDEWKQRRSKEETQLYRIQTRSQRAETVVPDQRDDG